MIYDTYKLFITDAEKPKLLELMNNFNELPDRIVKEAKGRNFTRFILNLSSEEATIIKLSLNIAQYILRRDDLGNKDLALFDAHIEIYSVIDSIGKFKHSM